MTDALSRDPLANTSFLPFSLQQNETTMHFLSQRLARAAGAGLFLLGVTSQAQSASAYECFDADGYDLKDAVDAYVGNPTSWNTTDDYSRFGPMEDWCTKFVTTMDFLFFNKTLNANITAWDTSSVTDMASMFHLAYVFNQDISAWDTSSVTDMSYMFHLAYAFNQDISAWDTSKVVDMDRMFFYAEAFNQDISGWDTSKVTTMSYMFFDASAFNQNLCAWKNDFPYTFASGIFSGSGCTDTSTPLQSNEGPFCAGSAADCQAYTHPPTNSPTNSPSPAPTNQPSTLPSRSPSLMPSMDPSFSPSISKSGKRSTKSAKNAITSLQAQEMKSGGSLAYNFPLIGVSTLASLILAFGALV
eukprot:scaffold2568_cov107-Skeletonema_dohrnii-CCMP3373.AAC.1